VVVQRAKGGLGRTDNHYVAVVELGEQPHQLLAVTPVDLFLKYAASEISG
jgi:hypothetical protein